MFKRVQAKEKIKLQLDWLDRYIHNKGSVYPVTIEVDASNACPLSCRHCVWEGMLNVDRTAMDEKMLNTIVEQASELGIKGRVWTGGGEPLANPLTVAAIQKSKSLGIKNAMFTNGLLLKREKAEELCDYLEWVRFNLGASNGKDYSSYYRVSEAAFRTVCSNIKYYCEIASDKSNIGIGTAVNPDNFDFVKHVPYLSESLGVGYCQLKPDFFLIKSADYIKWWSDRVEPYFNSVAEDLNGSVEVATIPIDVSKSSSHYCHAHHIATSITADGRVSFCKMKRDESKSSLGNIKEKNLKDIFDGFRHKEISATVNPENCSGEIFCPYTSVNNYVDELMQMTKNSEHEVFF